MSSNILLLSLVVATALAFDFTNGFHDTANAMAASIATGALKPRAAVAMSGALNFVGAFLSLSVAATIAKGIVDSGAITLTVVFAGLVGGIAWNLLTWYVGLPSSSSHALIGGVVGASLIAGGTKTILLPGIISKVVVPALLAPFVAMLVAGLGTFAVYKITTGLSDRVRDKGFRIGQVGTSALVSLAHGTNDAQKTMGVITLGLVANHSIDKSAGTPFWVIFACATAIAAGTYIGGWRIIRTLGKGLVQISPPQGFAAQGASTAVILASTHFGFPLSTTQVCTGSIIGSGLGKRLAEVRWGMAGKMAGGWILTLPAAAAVGAVAFKLASVIGGSAGILVVFAATVLFAAGIFAMSRQAPVTKDNVNADWTGSIAPHERTLTASST